MTHPGEGFRRMMAALERIPVMNGGKVIS